MNKWLSLVAQLAPVILVTVPGGAKIAPFVPFVIHGITVAEGMKGASGAEKKARALAVLQDSLSVLNGTGVTHVNQEAVGAAVSDGIDAVVAGVNAVHPHAAEPPTAPK